MGKTSFYISQTMAEVLDELVKPERMLKLMGSENRSKNRWLEYTMAYFLRQSLTGHVSDRQLERCITPDEICRLFVNYCKAMRKEKGYGFTAKDPTKRYVYSPPESG